ncbi:YidC/Oxa1 family membrane protein insertase [Saccharicrinis carchari]|uniref:Membrane protein insertase YidC n=1 Tax=Saccharicrinis carchari TaxID=1168039 RepID=A0A521BDW2_SACCC|nr:membrane protein insertase YidC [Saccharicrinis carchari]SMO44920.1 YidC/Oxa1 family membrane protein insertase [Saccharicrinis carchari]
MDRNSVTGMILIAIILGLFWWMNKPSEQEIEALKLRRDSIARVEALSAQEAAQKADINQQAVTQELQATPDSVLHKRKTDKFGIFSDAVDGENEFYTLENELLKVKFSSRGAKVYSVELKEFTNYKDDPLVLFDGDQNVFGFNFFYNNRILNTNDLHFTVDSDASNDSTLRFKLNLGANQFMAFDYKLSDQSYLVDFAIVQNNVDNLIQANRGGFDLDWKMDVIAQEKGRTFEIQYSGVYYKYYEDVVDDISGKSGDEDFRTPLKWIAFKDQFFSSILIAKDKFAAGKVNLNVYPEEGNSPILSTNTASLVIPHAGGMQNEKAFQFYFGPNKYKTLKKINGLDLEEIIPLGWGIFGWINKFAIIPIFNWLEGGIANYGLIILLLTLIIKLVLFPLTYKSYMSTAKMKVLKPQIDEINKKIPADKAMERQKATMALYSKAGVSPLGGCLPMMLQMPILFAMFRFFPASIELRHESFLWANDLSSYDSVLDLPFTIPFYGDHVSLFCLLMAITNIVYTKMNQEMTASTNQMPGMKAMMYMMPVMFLVFFNQYASGLSYYYFVSTLITIIQTLLIRRFIDEKAILAKLTANQKKPKKKSGFQARIEEMAKQQQLQQKSQKGKKKR